MDRRQPRPFPDVADPTSKSGKDRFISAILTPGDPKSDLEKVGVIQMDKTRTRLKSTELGFCGLQP